MSRQIKFSMRNTGNQIETLLWVLCQGGYEWVQRETSGASLPLEKFSKRIDLVRFM